MGGGGGGGGGGVQSPAFSQDGVVTPRKVHARSAPSLSCLAKVAQLMTSLVAVYRLVGLVVKASASRAGGPGFESR